MADSLFRTLQGFLAQGQRVATATIIRTAGSTPREVGAQMLIGRDGRSAGTIGGGCGEVEVMRAALDVLTADAAAIVRVDLTGEIDLDADGICGGVMDVLVEPWSPAGADAALLNTLADAADANRSVALATRLPPAEPQRVLMEEEGDAPAHWPAALVEAARERLAQRQSGIIGAEWFLEIQPARPTLLIAGGGHIALPLAQMGAQLDFRVVVVDDRPSFANTARFPMAEPVICQLFEPALRGFPIDRDTYIVIITRGHQHDVECLLAVIESPAAYIGMIGSRRRIKGVFELLTREEGIAPERLARVCSPIGLDIGARTPAEIAVAILAEIINGRRGGRAISLAAQRRGDFTAETQRTPRESN